MNISSTAVKANVYSELKIHAVSGTIIKSHPKSRFIRFHMNSEMARAAFSAQQPKINKDKVVILQVMLCGEKELIVEYMKETDYQTDEKGGEEE